MTRSATRRPSSQVVLIAAWFALAFALLVTLMVTQYGAWRIPVSLWHLKRLAEVWLLLGILGVSLWRYPYEAVGKAVGQWRLAILLVVLSLLLTGQYVTESSTRTYPFVEWNMYTLPVSTMTYHEYQLVDGDGTTERLSFTGVAPTTTNLPFLARLDSLAAAAGAGDVGAMDQLTRTLRFAAQAAGAQEAEAVDVRRCHVESPLRAESMRCESHVRVPLGSSAR